jgi:hypothetical protein
LTQSEFFTKDFVLTLHPEMKFERDTKMNRLTGLFFEILMIVFLFSSSYSTSTPIQQTANGQLTVQSSPASQIVFSNSETSSEHLFQCVSKFQIADSIVSVVTYDIALLEVKNSLALYVTTSLFNTFYKHLSAKAP